MLGARFESALARHPGEWWVVSCADKVHNTDAILQD